MMRACGFILAFAAAVVSVSAYADKKAKYNDYANSRRYCVGRDTKTIEGFVITTWYRNGKPDWILPSVVTNRLKSLVGEKQNNPIENERDVAKKEAEPANKIRAAKKNAEKKDQKNLEKAIKDMKKARDKSSEAMYDLYQSILDLLNEANAS